jgi:quinol monooxygenase YgiN
MVVRVVNIMCNAGMEDTLRQLGRDILVPVNREAGCMNVYFLEPNLKSNNPHFGVVSIWKDIETLDAMKNSEVYRSLLQNLSPLIESSTDYVYFTSQT